MAPPSCKSWGLQGFGLVVGACCLITGVGVLAADVAIAGVAGVVMPAHLPHAQQHMLYITVGAVLGDCSDFDCVCQS